jgi:hypothetical protein
MREELQTVGYLRRLWTQMFGTVRAQELLNWYGYGTADDRDTYDLSAYTPADLHPTVVLLKNL